MIVKKTRNVEISTEDLKKLVEYLRQHSKDSTRNLLCFTLAKLMMECGVRYSNASCLKKPFDITATDSPDEFTLVFTFAFRSSNGNEYKRAFKISKETRDLLVRIEELYESIPVSYRNDNPNSSPFVYVDQKGVVRPVSPTIFEIYIRDACRDLGLPKYSSHVFRHEYVKNKVKNHAAEHLISIRAIKSDSDYWSV